MYDFTEYGSHERRGDPTTEGSVLTWAGEYLGALLVVGLGLTAAGTMLVWLIGRVVQ